MHYAQQRMRAELAACSDREYPSDDGIENRRLEIAEITITDAEGSERHEVKRFTLFGGASGGYGTSQDRDPAPIALHTAEGHAGRAAAAGLYGLRR